MSSIADDVVPGHAGARRLADRLALTAFVPFLAILIGLAGTVCYCWSSRSVVRLGYYRIMGPNAHPHMTMRSSRLVTRRKTYSNVTVYQFKGGPQGAEIVSVGGLRILDLL